MGIRGVMEKRSFLVRHPLYSFLVFFWFARKDDTDSCLLGNHDIDVTLEFSLLEHVPRTLAWFHRQTANLAPIVSDKVNAGNLGM